MNKRITSSLIICLLLAAGCSSRSDSSPEPTQSLFSPVSTSVPAATATPAPATPSPSAASTAAPQEIPTRELYPYPYNGKWGFVNREGVFIIPPRYEHVRDFSEGKAIVLLGENRYAFVDSAGVQGEETYFTAQPYSGGFAAVRKVGLDSAGFIDHSGKTAFPDLNARDTHSFSEGLAAATDPASELAGYIDTTGQWVIPPKYITANPFAEGYAAVKESEHYGIIDREGTYVSESRFDDILGFSEGMAPFRSGNNWGVMNTEMRVVIDPVYAYIGPFHDGLAKAVKEQGGKYGYIGKDGRWAIPPVYRDAQDFHNGLAAVKVDGKYGFIDTKGQMVLPPRYDEVIQPFAYDTAFVRIGGDYRYITREGEILFGEPSP